MEIEKTRRGWKTWQLVVVSAVMLSLGVTVGLILGVSDSPSVRNDQSEAKSATTSHFTGASTTISDVTTPLTTPTQTLLEGTRAKPVPVGRTMRVSDWDLTVLQTTPDAAAQVASYNRFNDPPATGNQYVMVRLRATYLGSTSKNFLAGIYLAALGVSGRTYKDFSDSCGVIAERMPSNELFTGGTVEGNWCVSVQAKDVPGLLLLFGGEFVGGTRIFFSLT